MHFVFWSWDYIFGVFQKNKKNVKKKINFPKKIFWSWKIAIFQKKKPYHEEKTVSWWIALDPIYNLTDFHFQKDKKKNRPESFLLFYSHLTVFKVNFEKYHISIIRGGAILSDIPRPEFYSYWFKKKYLGTFLQHLMSQKNKFQKILV